jgi:hypothetical protein
VTRDAGRSWRPIASGLQSYVHVVREDPRNPQVLYAGTERGIFVSFDAGGRWEDFRLGLPHVPVYDLQVHPRDNDLIVGTHGRGFYVLDDLTPLQQWTPATARATFLFPPMPAMRYSGQPYHEHGRGAFVAQNKPYGALVSLYLAKAPPPSRDGKPHASIRVFSGARQIDAFDLVVHAGLNRFAWDLTTQAPGPVQDARPYYVFYPMAMAGPQVLPGAYTLTVDAGPERVSVPVRVTMDPHQKAGMPELQQQFDLLESLAQLQERAEAAIAQLTQVERKAGPNERAAALLDRLRNPDSSGYRSPARLSEQIAYLRDVIGQYDGAPTAAQRSLAGEYAQEMDALDSDIAAVIQSLKASHAHI